jgi:hypothetical protein
MRTFLAALTIAGFGALMPASALSQVGPGQRQQFMLGTRPAPDARKPARPLNTLDDLAKALRACWKPPAYENARAGMRMTMRFSLTRTGQLIGPPMVTYSTPDVSPKTAEIYREAMLLSLKDCMPLPLTDGLGGAIAGRPLVVWVVDDRKGPRELKA